MAAGELTPGRRVEWPGGDMPCDWTASEPGDYVKVPEHVHPTRRSDGQPVWYVRDPNGRIGALVTHQVTEHDDGTITVQPSILDGMPGGWHGWLERGVWREA